MVLNLIILHQSMNGYNKVIVIKDRETGLSFKQNYTSHKNGLRPVSNLEYSTIQYIKKASKLFNSRYEYSDYKGFNKRVTIYDTESHEVYSQNAQEHINGSIPIKYKESIANYDVFLERSKTHHGNKFEYLKFDWNNRKIKLKEVNTGKIFYQSVYEHSYGYLPRGAESSTCISLGERKLRKELKKLYPELYFEYNSRFQWLDGKELDIYIPELKLALEYNGSAFHHSNCSLSDAFLMKSYKDPEYHMFKFNKCKEQGITLIHIYDFEEYELSVLISKYLSSDVSIIENKPVYVSRRGKLLEKFSSKSLLIYQPVYEFVNKLLPNCSES